MRQITAFGDSIMRGIVLDEESVATTPRYTLLEESFSTRCGAQLGLEIKNHGRFGNTTHHGLRELERRREQIAASEYCVMEFGGNDCDHRWTEIAENPEGEHRPVTTLDHFAAQYHEMISYVRRLGSQPLLLSLPPILSDRYFHTITRTMDALRRSNVLRWLGGSVDNITRWHEMYNLKLFKLAAMLDVPIIDITSPFLVERNCPDLYCEDGIHPNERGHRLIADTICRVAEAYV